MKTQSTLFVCLLSLGSFAQQTTTYSRIDSVSYLAGRNIAQSVLKDFPEATIDLVIRGLADGLKNSEGAIQDPENKCVMNYFQEKMAAQQAEQQLQEEAMNAQFEQAAQGNKLRGEAFLAENAKKKGIVVTPSGLQYEVLKKGKGAHPTAKSTVKVHYVGTNMDGQTFDSSIERGEPITFPLDAVIKGWTEGVQLMSKGAKYRFYIPQELAYGQGSPTELIPPYSVLIFEVELLSIEK
ncbi:MAG: hypothetical protein RLZZ301_276 [Bacteroidota bacterium]|jgi:FKBP-type peptidyl-prolyl cis-trans isomerase